MVDDLDAALADAARAREVGADLVEFRIDSFFSGAAGETGRLETARVLGLVRESPLPSIVTCRPAAGGEGGCYDGDDSARISLYELLGSAAAPDRSPRYLDVELATYTRSANIKQKVNLAVQHPRQVRDLSTSLILSSHDFEGRPADLFRRLAAMRAEPAAAVLKIAYRARSLRDNLDLFDLLRESDRPMIALGMGEFGLMSRVLAPKFGGFLTFASLRPASTTAPGQPTVAELTGLYRFGSINAKTRVLGIIGYPVSHSLSPAVHNAGFEAVGEWSEQDAAGAPVPGTEAGGVYLPLPVPPEYEHFKATLGALLDHDGLDFAGCSVTVPHKEHLVRFAREEAGRGDGRAWSVDETSRVCGAGNTLVVRRGSDGRVAACRVLNTDAAAAVGSLEPWLKDKGAPEVAILGAGGAARALAAALLPRGATVKVFARSPEKAAAMCRSIEDAAGAGNGTGSLAGAALADLGASRPDAVINCTPVGMASGADPRGSPIPAEVLAGWASVRGGAGGGGGPVVMDTVYTPLETPLLRLAAQAGLPTQHGLGMFTAQAEAQFRAWTGRAAPPGLFERAAREALAARAAAPA